LFLQGKGDALIARLKDRMGSASNEERYELAAHYRDQIVAIERSLTPQHVSVSGQRDVDCFGFYREGAGVCVEVLQVRFGVLSGARGYVLKGRELPDEEVIEDFLAAYYQGQRAIPDQVLVPVKGVDLDAWSEVLSDLRGKRCAVSHPLRGGLRRLIALACKNATKTFTTRRDSRDDAMATLHRLQSRLGLKNLPARIECYDISNIQGSEAVGSMVVAIDGQLTPACYRHYTIGGLDTPNDFEMMREVLRRRVVRGVREEDLPDLIIVDGGRGQLRIAVEVLEELQVHDIELASLAKQRVLEESGHIKTRSHVVPSSTDIKKSEERCFRPGRKNPVSLKANSNELFLLVRLRDEAHRFAITHHKKRRRKRTISSQLSQIHGLGQSRQKALLKHFKSVRQVRAATIDALIQCPGISAALAHRIRAYFDQSS